MKNIAWMALAALLEAVQLTIIVALIFSFIPLTLDGAYYNFFPFVRKGLTPNRNMFFYRIFVITAIAVQAVLIFSHRKLLNNEQSIPKLRAWIIMAAIVLVPQLFLIYQMWLGPHPEQARGALCAVCALGLAVRVFWPEVYLWTQRMIGRQKISFKLPGRLTVERMWKNYQDAVVLVFLTSAFCVQAFLYAVAVIGWRSHRDIWPSSDPVQYVILAVFCVVVGMVAVWMSADRQMLTGFCKKHAIRITVEGLLSFFLLNALFKMHVYFYQPLLAQKVYGILLVISLVVNIGWPFIERFLRSVGHFLLDENNHPALTIVANAAFIVFIFLFFYVPDLEAAVARVFMGEQFHTIDACLTNTAWAYHAGCKLNVDVNNRYGLGMGVMVSMLSGLLGGVSYLNVYAIVMLACIVYFIAAYGLLRLWLKSVPLAMAGSLIFFKTQAFHPEIGLFYLINPSITVCRYFFDIPFLFMVLLFLRTSKKIFLIAAAFISAIALFYALDTGVYLAMAYYALLILLYAVKDIRKEIYTGMHDIGFAVTLCLIPPLGALMLLRLTQGPMVFSAQFWQNMTEYIRGLLWMGPVPIWENLRVQEYWVFGLTMWMMFLYVFTLIFVGGLVYLGKKPKENLFVVVMCVYGLAVYNYYINRPEPGSAFICIMPYVFILCFWLQGLAKRLNPMVRKKFYLALLGLCLYALWTTHSAIAYPNVFNFSRNPEIDQMVVPKLSQGRLGYFNFLFIEYPNAFKLPVNNLGETFEDWRTEDDFRSDEQLKEYYRQEFNFPEDAALIDGLVKPGEAVPLISSFEIQMLIQANRKPFFYIFPLINSRPMRMRLFEVAEAWTATQLDDTIRQLEEKKPPFVFMERIYLAREIPSAYLYDMPAVCALVNYVRENYEPYQIGKYLVAMKLRKPVS